MSTDKFADNIAEEITRLALSWSEGDAERLSEAERILAGTPYLGDNPAQVTPQ